MDLDESWQVGLRPEKTKPCTFPAKSRYGFWRVRKNGSQRRCFLWHESCTISATFLGSISAKLSTNTCPGGVSRHMVSCSRKVFINGSNFPKNRLFQGTLGYPVWARPTDNGKCSAMPTPTLFPSPSGHPTDLSFLSDFCWGMYRFPAVHLRQFPFATVSAMGIPGWRHSSDTWRKAGH